MVLSYSHNLLIEVVYNIEVPDLTNDNGRYLSIDIGVDNLSTITNNFNEAPVIINGKGLKSIYCKYSGVKN